MKRSELVFTAIKPPLDYLALIFAALVAYFIRYLPMVQKIRPVVFDLPFGSYFSLVLIIVFIWVVIFALAGLYTVRGLKGLKEELGRVFVACLAGLALVLAVMVFSRFLFDSRFIILSSWALAIIFVSLERIVIQIFKQQAYKIGFGIHRVAIVGEGQIANELVKEFSKRPGLGYKIIKQYPIFDIGAKNEIQNLAEQDGIDEIIQINPNQNTGETMELMDFINEKHLNFKYTADLLGTQLTNLDVTTFAGTPIVEVKRTRLDGWGRIYKRIFDVIGAVFLIIATLPIMFITAIAIKIDSQGSVLFRYKRIGQLGKPFKYFKFRSMVKDAHKYRFDKNFIANQEDARSGTPMMKFKNDPRVTKVGKFIRRFHIDELPELFLVLAGKMSLAGPRPHEIQEVERYKQHHKKVLILKPGITGLAQVSGARDIDFEKEINLDVYYIENWSLGLDMQILLKTPWAVIKGRQIE